jgi:hypothetical protein
MPLSAEQKEVLRERMAKAREAKIAKKTKNAEVMEAKPTPPPTPAPEPVKAPEPQAPSQVWSRPRHEPLPEPEPIAAKTPRSKPVKIPAPEPEKKTKYAKLVFYQEPGNNKKIKKLTKVLEQSSSEDEQEPVVVTPAPEPVVEDPNARYKKLARMSRLFFD